MIKLQILGNLGKDATVNDVSGKKVINFNVAHTENWTDSTGSKKSNTIWVDCAYWTDKDGIVPYLKKGQQVFVEGQPNVNSFSRQDGTAGASLTCRVQSVQLCGKAEGNAAGGAQPHTPPAQSNSGKSQAPGDRVSEIADDLPF